VQISKFSWRFVPADYTAASEVKPVFTMQPGDLIIASTMRITTAFNGTTPTFEVGTGEDVDGLHANTIAAGLYLGRGALFTSSAALTNVLHGGGTILCIVKDTIDVKFVGAGDATAGAARGSIYYIRAGSGG
jgi:hypothetical protein